MGDNQRRRKSDNLLGVDLKALASNLAIIGMVGAFIWFAFIEARVEAKVEKQVEIMAERFFDKTDGVRIETQLKATDRRVEEMHKDLKDVKDLLVKVLNKE